MKTNNEVALPVVEYQLTIPMQGIVDAVFVCL